MFPYTCLLAYLLIQATYTMDFQTKHPYNLINVTSFSFCHFPRQEIIYCGGNGSTTLNLSRLADHLTKCCLHSRTTHKNVQHYLGKISDVLIFQSFPEKIPKYSLIFPNALHFSRTNTEIPLAVQLMIRTKNYKFPTLIAERRMTFFVLVIEFILC